MKSNYCCFNAIPPLAPEIVQANGSKLWRLKYRFAGKETLLSLGPSPITSLAEARRKRNATRGPLATGTDPSAQERQDKIAAETAARNTFGAIAEEVLSMLTGALSADYRFLRVLPGGCHVIQKGALLFCMWPTEEVKCKQLGSQPAVRCK